MKICCFIKDISVEPKILWKSVEVLKICEEKNTLMLCNSWAGVLL